MVVVEVVLETVARAVEVAAPAAPAAAAAVEVAELALPHRPAVHPPR